jgi:hypothetical protein
MAIAATMNWDVRTTGSDSNGGGFDPTSGTPGTDFSQQNAAQVAFTDLVIGATTTQLTSAAHPFTSAHVGNVINIASGTGFTTGWYQVMSVSGSTATMDRAVGTAASTGGTGNLGGSLLTIAAPNAAVSASNTVHIKAGTYTITASIAVPQSTMSYVGYQTTHNDGGTKPLITTATNSVTLFNTGASNGGVQVLNNLSLSNTATTRSSGIWELSGHGTTQAWVIVNCIFDGFTNGIDSSNGTPDDVAYILVTGTEIKNCTGTGLIGSSSATAFMRTLGCYFHGNNQHIQSAPTPIWLEKTIFAASTGGIGVNIIATQVTVDQCTFANNTNSGGTLTSGSGTIIFSVSNSIFYGNSGVALAPSSANLNANLAGAKASCCNAFGSNGTNYANWVGSSGDVTLTANPFTNSGTGDYSLNATAGGGAACKGAGFPGIFPGATSTGHVDIGAVQSAGAGGSTGGSWAFVS